MFHDNDWKVDEEDALEDIVLGSKDVDTLKKEASTFTSISINEILEELAAKIDEASICKLYIS